ncbi:MAG: pseudouridine synthase [Spirochaetia bacterium]
MSNAKRSPGNEIDSNCHTTDATAWKPAGGKPYAPENGGTIQILHQDEEIVIIDKPPATLTHRHTLDRNTPNVQAVLERQLGRRIYIVHRLDRMTTGVMVIALTQDSARDLSLQFRNRSTTKRYLAIVRGHPDDFGRITNPLEGGTGDAVEAETSYTTLGRGVVNEPVGRYLEAWFGLVELQLHTGRRHQARRHLHRINHPVLGDNRHGDKEYNRWAASRFGLRQLYLRAWELAFIHPASGGRVSVSVALPDLWRRVLQYVGIDIPSPVLRETTVSIKP